VNMRIDKRLVQLKQALEQRLNKGTCNIGVGSVEQDFAEHFETSDP